MMESFLYQLPDAYAGGPGYVIPGIAVGADTIFDYGDMSDPYHQDSSAFIGEPYRYHTYTMEWLPHEVRILYDSVVIRRIPDRLIPPGSPFFDYASTMARGGENLIPGEFDDEDLLATPKNAGDYYVAAPVLSYFLKHINTNTPGFWPVDGQPAAHLLIDYVKVWDVPKDVIVPAFPK